MALVSRSSIGRLARALVIALLILMLLPYVIAPFYRLINPVSTLMMWRWVTGHRVARTWLPLAQMSPAMPLGASRKSTLPLPDPCARGSR